MRGSIKAVAKLDAKNADQISIAMATLRIARGEFSGATTFAASVTTDRNEVMSGA